MVGASGYGVIDDLGPEDAEPAPRTEAQVTAEWTAPPRRALGAGTPPAEGETIAIGPDDPEDEVEPELDLQSLSLATKATSLRRFTWEDYKGVSPIRDQGKCGSCWAFATTAAMESSLLLQDKNGFRGVNLSEQRFVACAPPSDGCGGFFPFSAMKWGAEYGVDFEGSLPYDTEQTTAPACNNKFEPGYKISRAHSLKSNKFGFANLSEIKKQIAKHGAVVSWIHVSDAFFDVTGAAPFDDHIVFPVAAVSPRWHIVEIVGWDDDQRALRIKNSWNTAWGDAGFAWVRYGRANLGRWTFWVEAKEAENKRVTSSPIDEGRKDEKDPAACKDKKRGWHCARDGSAVFYCTSTKFRGTMNYCKDLTQCTPDAKLADDYDSAPFAVDAGRAECKLTSL